MLMLASASHDADSGRLVLDLPLKLMPAQDAFAAAHDDFMLRSPTVELLELGWAMGSLRAAAVKRRSCMFKWSSLCKCDSCGRVCKKRRGNAVSARREAAQRGAGAASSAGAGLPEDSENARGESDSDLDPDTSAAW
eukprot:9993756-Alexandrium_andersonii.AAC.1